MKDYQALPHRWTLSFYQAKGGVREITVADGPCLTGNTTVEVVPASHLEGVVEDARLLAEFAEKVRRGGWPGASLAEVDAAIGRHLGGAR